MVKEVVKSVGITRVAASVTIIRAVELLIRQAEPGLANSMTTGPSLSTTNPALLLHLASTALYAGPGYT